MPKVVTVDKETILNLYVNKGFTLKEVCIATGIKSDVTLVRHMKKYGIDRRDYNKESSLLYKLNISAEEFNEKLRIEYIDEQMSQNELGDKYGVSHVIIKRYLKKFGIPLRDHKEAMKLNLGSNNPNWSEGVRYHSAGYKQLYMPNHPNAIDGKYVYEHRYIMEQKIGRLLETNEHVHHINGNKADNRLKNLQLTNSSEHPKIEAEQRKKKREENQLKMKFKGIV